MTKKNEIYKCFVCGNIVEILHIGAGELICCDKPMVLMQEKTKDEGEEKHVPVIEELPANVCSDKDGFKIKIGEEEHPMEKDHYIEWIEINTVTGKSGKKFLEPGDKPESIFHARTEIISARTYCNIHGLWESKK